MPVTAHPVAPSRTIALNRPIFLIHGLLLHGTMHSRMGRDADKPFLGQGLRFGIAIAILMTIPVYLIYYAVQPWPGRSS